MKKENKLLIALSVCLSLCVLITGALAFLTDATEKQKNVFTVGEIKIELLEPEWDKLPDKNNNDTPDDAESFYPNQVITKDPTVTNVGTNSAYIYVEVAVPKAAVKYIDEGTLITATSDNPIELFNYTPNDKWGYIGTDTSKSNEYNYHYYYYSQILDPEKTTQALFNSITYKDVAEGQIDDKSYFVDIKAYGVQVTDDMTVFSTWNSLAKSEKITDITIANSNLSISYIENGTEIYTQVYQVYSGSRIDKKYVKDFIASLNLGFNVINVTGEVSEFSQPTETYNFVAHIESRA